MQPNKIHRVRAAANTNVARIRSVREIISLWRVKKATCRNMAFPETNARQSRLGWVEGGGRERPSTVALDEHVCLL
jgi:hypothetical protein